MLPLPKISQVFYIGETLEKYIIFLSKKDKKLDDELYATVFWPTENRAELCRVYPSRGSSLDYHEGYHFEKPMISFGSLPDVTPANIHEKFKMYMLFS